MRGRIMVVSRDIKQRANLARLLRRGGYRIEIAENAAQACRIGFDGIALAIVTPVGLGPEGRGLVQDLRAAVGNVFLVGALGDRCEQGSDLLDVSDEASILARVAKALTTTTEPEVLEPLLQFSGYILDLGGHTLVDQTGSEIPLTHGEFSLLRIFAQRPRRVLSRDQLLQLLAGRGAEAYDRSIDMQIVRLRRKIEPDAKHPTLVVTVPGSGYKFTANIRQMEVVTRLASTLDKTAPAIEVGAAERRYFTVVAAEVVMTDESNLPADPEDVRALINSYRCYMTAVVARHGGLVAGSRMWEALAYFGYPVAHEHAAERALHAALALAKHLPEEEIALPAGLAIRIGVASGLVLADLNGEVLGETPAEAVRLQGLAEVGQVIIAESTRRLAGPMFACLDLGPLAIKGLPAPRPAWQVLGPSAHGSRSEALYLAALTPLVGREEELNTLLRAWEQAKSGEGRVMLLSGEPGIGKSRLLAAFEEQLSSKRHATMRHFCSPLHQGSAFHPLVARWEQEADFTREDTADPRLRKLRAILAPEDVASIAAMLGIPTDERYQQPEPSPQRRKKQIFEVLRRRLEQATSNSPLLMLFEDMQWADPSSLELLDALIERLTALPILLAISYRSDFNPPWAGRAGTSLIALSRLNRGHSEALAIRVSSDRILHGELLERIITHADGVPLFIDELTKAMLETSAGSPPTALPFAVPDTLQASLAARLDRLPAMKQVAQIGAVVGREFPYAFLAAAALMPDAQLTQGLEALIASGLASQRGVGPDAVYTFNHALTRDVAYASLVKSRRQICHQRIATVLEEFDGGFARTAEAELLA